MRIFAWQLAWPLDPFGNRIEYVYERDEPPAGGTQLYLSEIRYGDRDPAGHC